MRSRRIVLTIVVVLALILACFGVAILPILVNP